MGVQVRCMFRLGLPHEKQDRKVLFLLAPVRSMISKLHETQKMSTCLKGKKFDSPQELNPPDDRPVERSANQITLNAVHVVV